MNIKKILISSVTAVVMFGTFATGAFAAAPNWNITGTWTFNDIYQNVPFVHTMVINSFDSVTGAFSGTGFYNADPSLTWTITGTEDGNSISYTLLTGGSVPGVTLLGEGTVDSATSMSGTGDQSNLPGPMPNIDWTAVGHATPLTLSKDQCKNDGWKNHVDLSGNTFKNQGDCVSYVVTGGKNPPAGL